MPGQSGAGAATFGFGQTLMAAASSALVQHHNSHAAYWQATDTDPENPESEPTVENAHLDRDEAAAWLKAQASTGLDGVAGFACPLGERQKPSGIYVEAIDVRNGFHISLTAPISYSAWAGKIRFGDAELDILAAER
jgi:hypothetical protein